MTLEHYKKLSQHIFRLLKVSEIVFPIGRTNKGNLSIRFSNYTEGFEIMLDAVPLSTKSMLDDDNNIELKRMLEKYWFEREEDVFSKLENIVDNGTTVVSVSAVVDKAGNDRTDEFLPKKKRGRPAKSK